MSCRWPLKIPHCIVFIWLLMTLGAHADGEMSTPAIFGKAIISTELPEFGTSFSPAGDAVYFNRMPADRSSIDMFVSKFENGSWTEAVLLPFSGQFNDVDPFVSSDGLRLYFSSDRPSQADQEVENWNTWYVDRVGESWSEPIRLGPEVNTDGTEIFVSLTDAGTLYFRRSTDDSRDIYKAEPAGSGFLPARKLLGLDLKSAGNPMVARDGSYLILSGNVEGRGGDLFISFADGENWTPAVNMGPTVNTKFADFAPSISADGETLFFTSERPGMVEEMNEGRPPGDIYQIDLRDIKGINWPD